MSKENKTPVSNFGKGVQIIKDSVRVRGEGPLAWIELDLPGEKANVLKSGMLLRLREVIKELSTSPYKAVIFVSKKQNIFIAGADIQEIKNLVTIEDAQMACEIGQSIYAELESLPQTTIAAVNGACVGGGCEMILACDYRIGTDDRSTKVGLPEIQLGVLPGFGGTQRLPKLVGLQAALDIILAGKTVDSKKALKIGLLDQCVPKEILLKIALKKAQEFAAAGTKRRHEKFRPRGFVNKLLENRLGNMVIFSQARKTLMAQTKGNYPAPVKALEIIQKTYGGNSQKGFVREAKGFGELAVTDVSKNLIHIFFMTDAVKKSSGVSSDIKGRDVKSLAVLGAGTMGGGIAQLGAEKEISVRLKDIDLAAIGRGLKAAEDIFEKGLKRKKINKYEFKRKMGLISGTTDYSGFKTADVVIEAIVEDVNVKKRVLAETAKACRDDVVLATNTSSLSVSEIGRDLPKPEQFVGMHFFNPVHKMPLIEVIRSDKTNDVSTATIYDLSKKMGKTPIVVKDGPGFLVNRLLMPYLNESCYILSNGHSVEFVDKALLKFGMPMGPLHLIDEIGIDVAVKVAKILAQALGPRAEASPLMAKVVDSKKLGKKNGSGFYKYDDHGRKLNVDPEIYKILDLPTPKNTMTEGEIIRRALFPMINEAALCLEEKIVESAEMVDLGMIMGTGFPPFRGGLLKWADSLGTEKIVDDLDLMVAKYGLRFKPSAPLRTMAKAKRKFYS